MSEWHGYPQHEDAHPERPWWRAGQWTRADGVGRILTQWMHRTDGADFQIDCVDDPDGQLAAYDAAYPLPPPEPRCGQVWVWPDDLRLESMVVGITTASSGGLRVWWGTEGAPTRLWPLLGAVLVAGPGAPWAPMGGDDDR